jgi:hypothetical protein
MTTKMTDQIVKDLEELNFHRIEGTSHIIMEHPFAGRIVVSRSLGDGSKMGKRLIAQGRRMVGQADANAESFMVWLRGKYEVPALGSKVVQTTLQGEVKEWARLERKQITGGLAPGISKKGYIDILKPGQARNPSTIEIYGTDYAPEMNGDKPAPRVPASPVGTEAKKSEPICGAQHPKFPAVWCDQPPDHDGIHRSEAVDEGWWTPEVDEHPPTDPGLVAVVHGVEEVVDEVAAYTGGETAGKEAIIALVRIHAPELLTPGYELDKVKPRIISLRRALDLLSDELGAIEQALHL